MMRSEVIDHYIDDANNVISHMLDEAGFWADVKRFINTYKLIILNI